MIHWSQSKRIPMGILAIGLMAVLCGAGSQSTLPQEKFHRGDVVTHKLGCKGVVYGKAYVQGWQSDPRLHDTWVYDVHFKDDKGMLYGLKVYEFELEPPPAEKPQ